MKIIDNIINARREAKKRKAMQKQRKDKQILNKNEIIQEQADSINFLIQQLEMSKEKNIEQTRKIRELKKEIDFLTKRDNMLQNIEMLFENGKPTIAQIRKIINGK